MQKPKTIQNIDLTKLNWICDQNTLNLMNAKDINLEAVKLCKEKHDLPSSMHYFVIEPRFKFVRQPIASEQEVPVHFHQCAIPEAAPPIWLPMVLWAKEVEVEPAISTTGSS